jgi:hypothetical protein
LYSGVVGFKIFLAFSSTFVFTPFTTSFFLLTHSKSSTKSKNDAKTHKNPHFSFVFSSISSTFAHSIKFFHFFKVSTVLFFNSFPFSQATSLILLFPNN